MTDPATPMPEALDHYWQMWNEPNLDRVRGHLDRAVAKGFEFADPINHHVGRDALETNVRDLRTERPDVEFVLGSAIDGHHGRYRYAWHMKQGGRVVLRGLDVATLDEDGLLLRIDGFFDRG